MGICDPWASMADTVAPETVHTDAPGTTDRPPMDGDWGDNESLRHMEELVLQMEPTVPCPWLRLRPILIRDTALHN